MEKKRNLTVKTRTERIRGFLMEGELCRIR